MDLSKERTEVEFFIPEPKVLNAKFCVMLLKELCESSVGASVEDSEVLEWMSAIGFPTSERALEEMSISERNTVIQFAADYLAEQRDPTVKGYDLALLEALAKAPEPIHRDSRLKPLEAMKHQISVVSAEIKGLQASTSAILSNLRENLGALQTRVRPASRTPQFSSFKDGGFTLDELMEFFPTAERLKELKSQVQAALGNLKSFKAVYYTHIKTWRQTLNAEHFEAAKAKGQATAGLVQETHEQLLKLLVDIA